ncbi:hypothetical protein IE81DRAFT_349202 [Ceraceosorus guamensis]|uniref:Uncharacterized protein n=1 Tax=Ceraceosorus guamensis TaxID=1522189 RepID=A0A316VYB6_9BASI|nr:hypothetical protein IE81DRAFT_349202 [Ceraceosorus guamensis]PWN40465.1 hypothetical protein IE81DRAFT_349202 [Ceraceosorus guamensis]
MLLRTLSLALATLCVLGAHAQNCGARFGNALCSQGLCCSQYGSCGSTDEYCLTSKNCQSNCIDDGPPPPPKGPKPPNIDVGSLYRPPDGVFNGFEMVGYWSSWAQYYGEDPGTPACKKEDKHLPENINPFLFTHINYAFAFVSNTNFTIIPHELDDEDLSKRLNNWMKSNNPRSRTSLSLGGWTFTDGPGRFTGGIDYSQVFSQLVSTRSNREIFIDSCIDWCRRLGFDGIDLDWEYVGDTSRGGSTSDGANFLTLLQEMRAAFRSEASSSGKAELLITVAAPADPAKVALFDIKACQEYIDWYNLMSYDFYGNWDPTIDSTAPVYDTFKPTWSFDSAIHLYLDAGVSASKINAGLPAYGRVWTLQDVTRNTPGSQGGPGTAGRCTGLAGYMGWFEIVEILNVKDRLTTGDEVFKYVPGDGAYATFDDQWVGFDDSRSVAEKVALIKQYGLRGGMIWAVDLDTKDYSFTRSVLEGRNSCPKNGDWLPTPAGVTASLLCENRSGALGDDAAPQQKRLCKSDATWDVVDLADCNKGLMLFQKAKSQCI